MKNCLKLSCLRIFFSNISKVRITNIRPLRWYNTSKCSFQNLLFSILVCSGFLQFLCRYFLQIFFFSFFCWWYSLTGLLILQSFAVTFRCPTTFHFAQPRDSFFAIKTYAPSYMCKISAQLVIQLRIASILQSKQLGWVIASG